MSWTPPQITDDVQVNADNVVLDISPDLSGVDLDPSGDVSVTFSVGVYDVSYSYVDVNGQGDACRFTVTVHGS